MEGTELFWSCLSPTGDGKLKYEYTSLESSREIRVGDRDLRLIGT